MSSMNWAITALVLGSLACFNHALANDCDQPLADFPCNADFDGNGEIDVDDVLAVVGHWGETGDGDTRPTGDGAPMPNGDCIVDINDLLATLDAFGQECSLLPQDGACWLPDDTCEVLTHDACTSAGGVSWVAGADCTDTDDDRIPDAFELNDCSAVSGGFTGTDPNNPDTDGDSLKDGDEAHGTTAGLDLPGYGCDPCRKDILIECDWLYGPGQSPDEKKLHSNQVDRVVAAFNNAPNTNPNGVTGINMVLDNGQEAYGGGNAVPDPSNDLILALGSGSNAFDGGEFPGIKTNHLAANRHGYFHYLVMCKQFSVGGSPSNSTGKAELPGDDFCVSFSSLSGDDNRIGNLVMHELGHNLNLRHGGHENRNYKANYNSVMNYNYAFCGVDNDGDIDPDSVLDYSRGTNIDLDENNLNEGVGVTGSGPAIDWNQNGNNNQTGVVRNINCIMYTFSCSWNFDTNPCGSGSGCGDSGCHLLTDNNDWQAASFTGIIDTRGPRESVTCMPQPE